MSTGRNQPGRGAATQPPEPQTITQRGWQRLNLSDTPLSVADDELAYLENGMYLGKSIQAVPLYGGSAGNSIHGGTIKESFGCQLTYGSNTLPHPVSILIFEDGSAWMRDHNADAATDTQIAAVATFSASPKKTHITIWQDGPVLIIDDTWGYGKWDGTTLTKIDGTKTGHMVCVFEGHSWLLTAARTVTYTAPNTFDDFTAGNGAGSFKITDEAFEGQIYSLVSTVEQMWIIGATALDALGNVATASGVTTFAITNALTSIGSIYPDAIIGYFRALTFYTGYSIEALLGLAPQKNSSSIDRFFPFLSAAISNGPKVGIQELNAQTLLVFLFTYTDPVTLVQSTKLLCFQEGKWWVATTPDLNSNRVLDLVTLTINGTPEVYGIDNGGFIYRIFARTASDILIGTMTVRSGMADCGDRIEGHDMLRVGFDVSTPGTVANTSLTINVSTEANQQTFVDTVRLLTFNDTPLNRRYALHRRDANVTGQRLRWAVQMPCKDLPCLEAAHFEWHPTTKWDIVDAAIAAFTFFQADGVTPFVFTTASGGTFVFTR